MSTDHAVLRDWLAARRADVEHAHRGSWTDRADLCFCDAPVPCEDRARGLAMVDGLEAALDELEQLRARVNNACSWCASARRKRKGCICAAGCSYDGCMRNAPTAAERFAAATPKQPMRDGAR